VPSLVGVQDGEPRHLGRGHVTGHRRAELPELPDLLLGIPALADRLFDAHAVRHINAEAPDEHVGCTHTSPNSSPGFSGSGKRFSDYLRWKTSGNGPGRTARGKDRV